MVGSGAYHCCARSHASAQPMRYDRVFKTRPVLSSISFSIKARSWGLKGLLFKGVGFVVGKA
jgi:hypothetical protein